MKKFIILLLTTAVITSLTACSNSSDSSSEESVETSAITTEAEKQIESQTEEETSEELSANIEEEFLESDFFTEMTNDGYPVLSLNRDTERFILTDISNIANVYTYTFSDKETSKDVYISVTCGSTVENVDQLASMYPSSGSEIATLGLGSSTAQAYLFRDPSNDEEDYSLMYIPKAGYTATVKSSPSTKNEILDLAACIELL